MRQSLNVFAILLLVLPLSGIAVAQAEITAPARHEFSAWTAFSFANGHAFGFAQNRSLFLTDLRYGRLIGDLANISFRYVVEVRPIVVLGDLDPSTSARIHTYGAGGSPIGLQMNFADRSRVQPFLASNAGFLYFNRRILAPQATQFNFTVFIASGVEFRISSGNALDAGYMYHHISNANIAGQNPGVDAHMIFVGFSWYR